VINRHKVAKHFAVEITEERFSSRRKEGKIAAEAALDGLYVVRTSVSAERFSADCSHTHRTAEPSFRVPAGLAAIRVSA